MEGNVTTAALIEHLFQTPSIVLIDNNPPGITSFALNCQVCNKPIDDHGWAMIVAHDPGYRVERPPTDYPIVHRGIVTHKGICHSKIIALLGEFETYPTVCLDEFCREAMQHSAIKMEYRKPFVVIHSPAFELDI